MRSSRGNEGADCRRKSAPVAGSLAVLVLVLRSVLEVADALLHLAFRLVGDSLRLLAAVAGHLADLLARLAGDVLHVSLGLVLVHPCSFRGQKRPPTREHHPCQALTLRSGPAFRPGEAAARGRLAEALLREHLAARGMRA